MKNFWQELKRRKVIRVAIVYVIGAWVSVEVASVLFPALLLPDWTTRLVVALALIGFPVTVVLAWTFDVTERGVQKTAAKKDQPPTALTGPPESTPEPEDRLEGWKRIANFLNRDVRTVRRWEKDQNLPVHRVMHQKGATVYAYRAELASWLDCSDQQIRNASESSAKGKTPKAAVRWAWVVTAITIAIAVGAYWWVGKGQTGISFGKHDWVLITQFDNRTSEDVLNGTLEYALERELNNSVFVKVIPRYRVEDALQLMKLPVDSVVNLETGRQISLRDGEISILLTGRIDKVGETYALTVNLIRASDALTLASLRSISESQSQILQTVAELAVSVRESLGEELNSIEASSVELARVSTSSLQALQLYSRAEKMMYSGARRAKAMPLLDQALRFDPEFASAHLLLYYLYKDRDEAAPASAHLEQAMTLSVNATERERLFIISSDHSSRPQEWEKAIEISEILAGIYPDHFWAASNIASLNQVLGRYEEAYPYRLKRADLRPNVGWSQLEAAYAATVYADYETRDRYIKRAEEIALDIPWVASGLTMIPFYEAWISGDMAEALSVLERIVDEIGVDALQQNGSLFVAIRSAYLSLGKLEKFIQLSAMSDAMGWMEVVLRTDGGDTQALDKYLVTAEGNLGDAMLLAWTNRAEEAEAIILNPPPTGQVSRPYFLPNFKYLAMGELAIANNQPEKAIEFLNHGLTLFKHRTITHYLFALNALARAQIMLDQTSLAIETLESGIIEKNWTIFEPGATDQWIRNQLFLMGLYEQQEMMDKAKAVADELEDLYSVADEDHPALPLIESN